MHGSMGETALATESTSKAYELLDRASDREKFFITAYYDGRATGNQEKAQLTCEAWAQTYPREFLPHSFLSVMGVSRNCSRVTGNSDVMPLGKGCRQTGP